MPLPEQRLRSEQCIPPSMIGEAHLQMERALQSEAILEGQ